MKYRMFLAVLIAMAPVFASLSAQQLQRQPLTSNRQGWTVQMDLGLDFLSTLLINPAVGQGENRLGIGASLNLNTVFNSGRFGWTNYLGLDYGVQKAGSGVLNDSTDRKVPFQKNIDNIWLNSRASQRTSYFSKFYYAADLFFSSQLTSTYEDGYLSDITGRGHPISKFMSPALFQLALGMDYRPNDYWSVFLSPLAYKSIIVVDDQIADDFATDENGDFLGSIHGNPFETDENDDVFFQNYDNQFGAAFRAIYRRQFSDRFAVSTNLLLFSNYFRDPDHIDINWRNQLELTIFKGLKLSLLSMLTYDHDILVQITDNSRPDGVGGLGRRVSYTQQLLLRYTYLIDTRE